MIGGWLVGCGVEEYFLKIKKKLLLSRNFKDFYLDETWKDTVMVLLSIYSVIH